MKNLFDDLNWNFEKLINKFVKTIDFPLFKFQFQSKNLLLLLLLVLLSQALSGKYTTKKTPTADLSGLKF